MPNCLQSMNDGGHAGSSLGVHLPTREKDVLQVRLSFQLRIGGVASDRMGAFKPGEVYLNVRHALEGNVPG